MNGQVVHLQPDAHRALQELLPWYASGVLDADERTAVEQHLAGCAQCQAELDFERRLQQQLLAVPGRLDADAAARGLERLRRRTGNSTGATPARAAAAAPSPWLRWAVAAQFAVIAGLAALLLVPAERYRGLGNAATSSDAQVVVRFRPDASERQIRQALAAVGARIVNGPTATDAYVLAVPAARAQTAAAALRAHGAVALAESLEARTPP